MYASKRYLRHCGLGLLLVLGACGGSDTRFCFSTSEFCGDVFDANRTPDARISAPDEATVGETVFLDGGNSRDLDGRIDTYLWSQVAGPLVDLEAADAEVARFTAPSVNGATDLRFRLTVTDNENGSDSTTVTITVLPLAAAAAARGWDYLNKHLQPVSLGGTTSATDSTLHALYERLWLTILALGPLHSADDVERTVAQDQIRVLENQASLRGESASTNRDTLLAPCAQRLGLSPPAGASTIERILFDASLRHNAITLLLPLHVERPGPAAEPLPLACATWVLLAGSAKR